MAQSVAPPEVNVTVPVASPGRPVTDSVSCEPKGMLAGEADSAIAVSAWTTVKLAPVATDAIVVAVTRVRSR